MPHVTLTTKRLLLRPWTEADAPRLFELCSDPKVGPACGFPPHTSVGQSLSAIRDELSNDEAYAVALAGTGEVIGCASLRFGDDACSLRDDEPELGFWIGSAYWGRGFATEAARRLVGHAFLDLSCSAVWCCHYEGNEASRRVQQKLGFSYVRTNPRGDTRLGYTLPEVESVLTRAAFDATR
ncbi:MAG: GNAT family N-acetyltransferase [Olsenella sp.]|nr:GNAT family N-acetyltransferase [Olsenella sp.]MCI1289730.1 GNAT family N-acetyltransferase [Olsenella sp.]